jgi:hypothetical protein
MQYNLVIKLITYTPVDVAMDFSKMHFGFMINISVKKIVTILVYQTPLNCESGYRFIRGFR